MGDVRRYLAAQEKSVLIDLLMEHAKENDRIRQRVLLLAVRRQAKGIDLDTYRRAIDAAADTGDFVQYGAVHDYAQGIHDAIDSKHRLVFSRFIQIRPKVFPIRRRSWSATS